jgi:thiol-disulfide isomerase/thioredoxin
MMKSLLASTVLACALAVLPVSRALAQDAAQAAPAPDSAAVTEFKALFEKIQNKLKAGARTETDLADEIKAFDPILAKANAQEGAMISVMKARLYLEVLQDIPKALPILKQIKTRYPDSDVAGRIDGLVASLEAKLAAEAQLAVGAVFPTFKEQDLDGQPLDLAAYRGKVVLIDFWATWCGPCVAELPHVLAAYEKYHAKGFDIIGISLDKDRAKLTAFIKEKNMAWRHYFDGLGWENKVSTRYGIDSIPATFLLDKEGRIVAKDLRGDDLEKQLAALLK